MKKKTKREEEGKEEEAKEREIEREREKRTKEAGKGISKWNEMHNVDKQEQMVAK